MSEELRARDRAIEEIAKRLGIRAEQGKRFAELTSLRVGGGNRLGYLPGDRSARSVSCSRA
jgi:hypothetical protein